MQDARIHGGQIELESEWQSSGRRQRHARTRPHGARVRDRLKRRAKQPRPAGRRTISGIRRRKKEPAGREDERCTQKSGKAPPRRGEGGYSTHAQSKGTCAREQARAAQRQLAAGWAERSACPRSPPRAEGRKAATRGRGTRRETESANQKLQTAQKSQEKRNRTPKGTTRSEQRRQTRAERKRQERMQQQQQPRGRWIVREEGRRQGRGSRGVKHVHLIGPSIFILPLRLPSGS